MKKANKLFLLMLFIAPIFFGCNRDKESEGISRITEYPTFKLEGGEFMSIIVGGTYSEPGIKVFEGDTEIPFTTTGTVDPNTVGVYEITYAAKNKDNYAGTAVRTIAILPSAELPKTDISGKYANVGGSAVNGSNALVSTVTKVSPGLYRASNVWGGTSLAIISAYIMTVDGTNLILPESELGPYGRVTGTGTLNAAGLMDLSVTLLDQGPFTAVKKWQKQ